MNTIEQDCFVFKLLMRTQKEPSLIMFQDQGYNLVTKLFHDMHEVPCVIYTDNTFEHGLTMVSWFSM